MAKNKKIVYWARPITTYSKTHADILNENCTDGELLSSERISFHERLYKKYKKMEQEVHDHLKLLGYKVIDPGSELIATKFEAWRNISDDNKASPMPFFTKLCDSCDIIAFTPFDDSLHSAFVPDSYNRIGCGMVKEIESVVNRDNAGKAFMLLYFENDGDPIVFTSDFIDWDYECKNKLIFNCLDYEQTKSLLLLEGYNSRSSKHKK